MIPLSYSRIGDAGCPYRFKLKHIDRSYKDPESDEMRIGSEIHRVAAEYYEHCYKKGFQSDLEFFDTVTFPEDISPRCMELLKAFKESEAATVPTHAEWVQIESKMSFDVLLKHMPEDWTSEKVAFRLVVDRAYKIDNTLYIHDLKTGRGEPDKLQLDIYAYLVRIACLQHYEGKPMQGKVDKVICVFDEIAKRNRSVHEYEVLKANAIRPKLQELIKMVNSWTEYPATACSACKWCHIPDCPIKAETSTALLSTPGVPTIKIPDAISTQEEAEKALLFVQFADGIVDSVKDLLRGYVSENGPIYAGGKVAQFTKKESWKAKDLAALSKALVSWGAPPELIWSNLSLTKAALDKVVKKAKLSDRLPFIRSMCEVKASSAFGINNDKTI